MDDATKPEAISTAQSESVFSMIDESAAAHSAELTRSIYASIAQDAAQNATAREHAHQSFMQSVLASSANDTTSASTTTTATPSLDDLEQQRLSQLASLCNAHAAAADPITAGVDATMNPAVLTGLLNSTQLFVDQLNALVAPAQDLEAKGRPQFYQTLKAWLHDAQATSALIHYALHAAPGVGAQQGGQPQTGGQTSAVPAAPQPTAAPAPATPQLDLTGIWDMQLADGRRVEFSCDGKNFSYVLTDNTFAYWGTYAVDPQQDAQPLISITRGGGYPTHYYGPLYTTAISYPPTETWGVSSFDANKVVFGNCFMTRRPPVAIPLINSHISQIIAQFNTADTNDASNLANFQLQQTAVKGVQDSMWAYINSGVGRP